jgi:hypothetical protein
MFVPDRPKPRAGIESGFPIRTSRRPLPAGSSRQRKGAEPAVGEGARDGVVVIQRIKDIAAAQRPEQPVIFAAQIEVDRGIGRNQ